MTPARKQPAAGKMRDYAKFLEQIEIEDVSLTRMNAEVFTRPTANTSLEVKLAAESSYEAKEGGFVAFVTYHLELVYPETKKQVARMSQTFAVEYRSGIPMTDQIFSIFRDVNLPVNTWPYFRELTHNTLARMKLPGFVAPSLKVHAMPGK